MTTLVGEVLGEYVGEGRVGEGAAWRRRNTAMSA